MKKYLSEKGFIQPFLGGVKKMNVKKLFSIVLVLVCALVMTQTAQAVKVTNNTSTLFLDDFESASSPSSYPWEAQDGDANYIPDSDPDGAHAGARSSTEATSRPTFSSPAKPSRAARPTS